VTDSANLDLVRSIFAAWERGDFSHTAEWAHPQIEYVFADGPAPWSSRGLAGLARGYRDFLSAWAEYRTHADEFRELDNGRVLVLSHFGGHGKTSGVELGQISTNGATVFEVHDNKVTRLVAYFDRANALAALGLEE
jgi:ketosteroid isomerase-like protein